MTKDSPQTSVLRDAPKRIWAWVSDLWINGQPGGTLNQWHTSPPIDNPERAYPHIRAEAAALSEAPEVQALIAEAVERATRVKPLVWEDRGGVDYASDRYLVQVFFGSDQYYFETWDLSLGLKLYDGDDLPSAKAAAQADYEHRIRAAIGGNENE